MQNENLKKALGIKIEDKAFINKFKLLEDLYNKGKISLEELSILTELNKEKLRNYFSQKEENINEKKTVLICGGAGFIGSNFILYLHQKYKNYKIINYDKLTYAGNPDNLIDLKNSPRYKFIKGDIADFKKISKVILKYKPDWIVNFAAETSVGRSVFLGVHEFVRTNVVGVVSLLEAVRTYKISKFVHFSTDEVYGTLELSSKEMFREDSPFKPNVPYAASKAGGDLMCRSYFQTFKTPVIVTHCSNNYGPRQYPEKAIPFWILRALKKECLFVHGDGRHIRDWLFVEDNCRAIDLILHKGIPGEVYNIGAQNERSILEVALEILKILGRPKSLIRFIKDRPGNDLRYSLDISKIKRELNWQPLANFENALAQVVDWYVNNEWWIKGVFRRAKKFKAYISETF